MLIRIRTLYSGRVQGVGFRYTTAEVAKRHPVFGQVRNLSDGRVELVAEGQDRDIKRFLRDVIETVTRNRHGEIESVDSQSEQIEVIEFDSYQIVR